jgi:hypothetical protein
MLNLVPHFIRSQFDQFKQSESHEILIELRIIWMILGNVEAFRCDKRNLE